MNPTWFLLGRRGMKNVLLVILFLASALTLLRPFPVK